MGHVSEWLDGCYKDFPFMGYSEHITEIVNFSEQIDEWQVTRCYMSQEA